MQHQQNHTSLQASQPLVSFIITYYDLPIQMLCECINSVLALSLCPNDREIIVIDDGSEVSPMNGLMQYGDDIIYVRQKNSGVSMARNTGMDMAKGKYIQLIDGDDALIKTPYDHCLDIIRKSKEEIDMVLFDFTHSSKDVKLTSDMPKKTSGAMYMRNNNIYGAVHCYFFRRDIRGQLAFTPNVAYGEDEEFTPQLFLRAECIYTTRVKAYFYRRHGASAIKQSYDKNKDWRLNDNLGVIIRLQQLCDKLPPNNRLALQRRVAQLTMDYIYNTIVLKRSRQALNECIEDLHTKGLFPLPDHDYSKKYSWFRRMTNSAIGRALLLNSLPLLKKER